VPEFTLEVEYVQGADRSVLVVLHGPIDAKATAFQETLGRLRHEGMVRWILEMKDVTYINSTALGHMVNLHDFLEPQGGAIYLVGVPSKVKSVLDMMGLTPMFKMAMIRSQALDAVAKGGTADRPPPLPPA